LLSIEQVLVPQSRKLLTGKNINARKYLVFGGESR
jgi:hypothetical protein